MRRAWREFEIREGGGVWFGALVGLALWLVIAALIILISHL